MDLIATAEITGPEARGRANLSSSGDGRLHLRISDFWVAPAPDPHIYLTTRDSPKLEPGNSLHVGRLPTDTNTHLTELPAGVQLENWNFLVVYCVKFDVHFGSGRLMSA